MPERACAKVGRMQCEGDWTIRPATSADGLPKPAGRAGFVFVAADAHGARLGHARTLESDGSFHLLDWGVSAQCPERRIAAGLLARVEAEVAARGASAFTLLASFADQPLFADLGYVELTRLPVALRWLAADPATALESGRPRMPMAKSLAPDVVPRPAVSVLPIRDGTEGLEVFAQHRVTTMDFAAGAVVFPGGRVDVRDHEQPVAVPAEHVTAWAATSLPAAETLAAAAIREVAEECGVVLEAAVLRPWDNWVTPPGGRRRFDVGFFVTAVTAADSAGWANTTTEARRSAWESVPGLLVAEAAGAVRLMPPTKALLAELSGFSHCAEVLAHSPLIEAVLDDEPIRPRRFRVGR